MIHALQEASEAIKNGEVVCIFAEGQITRIGHPLPFRRGFERIMKDVEAPIIPVALDGVWGSIFSFQKGRFLWKMPRRIAVSGNGQLWPAAAAHGDAIRSAPNGAETYGRGVASSQVADASRCPSRLCGRRGVHPFRFAMGDAQNAKVSFGSALVRTVFLARRLKHGLVGPEDGRAAFAALGAGRAGEFCGDADG